MSRGFTLIELLFVTALMATIIGAALPLTGAAIDHARTSAAARYVAGRLQLARMTAVKRSKNVGMRIEPAQGDRFTIYGDGDGDGVLTRDIAARVDRELWGPERLGEQFPGVRFGVLEGVKAIEAGDTLGSDADPVQIGRSDILSFSPMGTSTSGSLYICGKRRQQYAVRVLGATGRVRVLRFNFGTGEWLEP